MNLIAVEKRGNSKASNMLVKGTLEDLLEAGTDPLKRRILNGLDFPLGHRSCPPPPQFE
jgi:hypothetical protein